MRVIEQVCGAYTEAYADVFYELNKTLDRRPKPYDRPAQMPACPKWRHNVMALVTPGDSLDTILLREVGRTGRDRLLCPGEDTQSVRCNKTFRDLAQQVNPGKNLDELKDGQKIMLPLATYAVNVKVKLSADLTIKLVREKIAQLGRQDLVGGPIISNEITPPIRMLAAVPANDLEFSDRACAHAREMARQPWPYDSKLVAKVLQQNLAAARELEQPVNPATVTVIDTGVARSFPESYMREDRSVDAVYAFGIGVYRQDIRPFKDQIPIEERLHGTEVAEILTGSSGLKKYFPELNRLFRINVVNLMVPTSAKNNYEVEAAGLERAIKWFVSHADIANISVGSDSDLPSFSDVIRRDPTKLIVVAAGNDTDDIGKYALYPANYGGTAREIGDQVITVGAYNSGGDRTSFSNWSDSYVDLFAPGCDITYGPQSPGVSGTSFAAPLVTMTAALLHALGIKSPNGIKERLEASIDYDPAYANLAVWSGRLNIAKALSVYDDLVELVLRRI